MNTEIERDRVIRDLLAVARGSFLPKGEAEDALYQLLDDASWKLIDRHGPPINDKHIPLAEQVADIRKRMELHL